MTLTCDTTRFVGGYFYQSLANPLVLPGNFSWHYDMSAVDQIDVNVSSSSHTFLVTMDNVGYYTCVFAYQPSELNSAVWTISATRLVGKQTVTELKLLRFGLKRSRFMPFLR